MTVSNFPNGISCAKGGDALGAFPLAEHPNYIAIKDDFIVRDFTDTWTHTQTNASTTITGSTGVINIITAGADNDKGLLASKFTPFSLVAGKKFAYSTRFKVTGGSGHVLGKEGLVLGLASIATGTDFISADGTAMAFDNGIGFYSSPASNLPSVFSRSGDTETRVSLASQNIMYGDNTWQVFHAVYNGVDLSFFFGTDNLVTKVAKITTNIPTAALAPTFYMEAGEAKAKTLSVDYYRVIAER